MITGTQSIKKASVNSVQNNIVPHWSFVVINVCYGWISNCRALNEESVTTIVRLN